MAVDSKQLVGEVEVSQTWTEQQVSLLLKGFLEALVKEQQGQVTQTAEEK